MMCEEERSTYEVDVATAEHILNQLPASWRALLASIGFANGAICSEMTPELRENVESCNPL